MVHQGHLDLESAVHSSNKQNVRRPCHDKCFVSNCFCCDCCVWAPLNPRFIVPSGAKKKWVSSKPCWEQFKQNLYFYLTITILLGLDGVFLWFSCRALIEHIHLAVVIIAQVLMALVLISLFVTACTDPGIIPASTDDEAAHLEREYKIPQPIPGQPFPAVKAQEVTVHGQRINLKYCPTCRFFRPPRSSHCSTCNVCVEVFDHHCPWIGNCVGRRNYRSFFLFLNSLAALGVYICACLLAHLIIEGKDGFVAAIKLNPGPAVEFIVVSLAIWSVLGLLGLHYFLVLSNVSTNEDIKGTWISRRIPGNDNSNAPRYLENPFSYGSPYLNCRQVLCSVRIATRLRRS